MHSRITIEQDRLQKGNWIRVHIPYTKEHFSTASIQDMQGATLKKVRLFEGSNAIDISAIADPVIHLKVETPFETILKEIQISS